jgi:catechol 2,3-dioxygenase-like lactoylglutathione lyase family enzyme
VRSDEGEEQSVAHSEYRITGIQQVGIGVADLQGAWTWYADHFGFDVPAFNDAAEAPFMTRYTGDAVQRRQAALAINMHGGGGFEVWQYTSRTPQPPARRPRLGDHGILAVRLKSGDVAGAHARLTTAGAAVGTEPAPDPGGRRHFVAEDPYGNPFQIVEGQDWFTRRPGRIGGVAGVLVGTPDIEGSLRLYRDVLGYDRITYDETGSFADLAGLPAGNRRVRRVLLEHSSAREGGFSPLLGDTAVELVESLDEDGVPIFADRYWGDLGFIHVCFEVQGMDELKRACEAAGVPFTVDSGKTFDMGDAGGRFAYVEDAAGTLVEFVETHRLPVLPALGIKVDLTRGGPGKTVPRWVIRLLSLKRTRTL